MMERIIMMNEHHDDPLQYKGKVLGHSSKKKKTNTETGCGSILNTPRGPCPYSLGMVSEFSDNGYYPISEPFLTVIRYPLSGGSNPDNKRP